MDSKTSSKKGEAAEAASIAKGRPKGGKGKAARKGGKFYRRTGVNSWEEVSQEEAEKEGIEEDWEEDDGRDSAKYFQGFGSGPLGIQSLEEMCQDEQPCREVDEDEDDTGYWSMSVLSPFEAALQAADNSMRTNSRWSSRLQ